MALDQADDASPPHGSKLSLEVARARAERAIFELPSHVRVGRYVLLATLGRGAMGVVYSAYDPRLDRKIAVKVLAPSSSGDDQRLFREAQALARLRHPNVVAIHDVGVIEDESSIFLAMEYVEGVTFSRWITARPRAWGDVLALLVDVARGLAAAHGAGLVHRDIKPDNIMVDDEERARVMDFGLARATFEAGARPTPADDAPDPEASAFTRSMTNTGAVLGTPAYMAPEQLERADVDARADQFSFCVTAWEALNGQRPFAGKSLLALSSAIREGRLEPPTRTGAPVWLRRVIARGLAFDPDRRWPNMEALARALQQGRARTRRRRFAIFAVGIAGAAALVLGVRHLDRSRRAGACEQRGAELASVWGESARTRVVAAITATEVLHADLTADKTADWLDVRARALQNAGTSACTLRELDGAWSEEEAERANWCLDELRTGFVALVDELGVARPEMVHAAIEAAAELPDAAACTRTEMLARVAVPDETDRGRIVEIHRGMARARTLEIAASYDESLRIAQAALEEAQAVGWVPSIAAARFRLGTILRERGDLAEAEAAFEEAYFEAARVGSAEIAADAAIALTHLVGDERERHADGLRWARLAERDTVRLADDAPRLASLLQSTSLVHEAAGDYDEALALAQQALALREEAFGASHPVVATSLADISVIHGSRGELGEARDYCERALGLREQLFGPVHPDVAKSVNNLGAIRILEGRYVEAAELHTRAAEILDAVPGSDRGAAAAYLGNAANALLSAGELDRAKALVEQSLVVLEQAYGPDHAKVGRRRNNLATILHAQRDLLGARREHERSLAILEGALGSEHPDVVTVAYNLANVAYELDDFAAAKLGFTRALEGFEQALGEGHPSVGTALASLANTNLNLGNAAAARIDLVRALAIQEANLAPDHPDLTFTLAALGAAEVEEGEIAAAVEHYGRALSIREGAGMSAVLLSQAQFGLAQAQWLDEQREQGRANAEQALARLHEHAPADPDVTTITSWLSRHPLP